MNMSSFNPVAAVLLIPIGAAALLALLPGYRLTARAERGGEPCDLSFGALAVR